MTAPALLRHRLAASAALFAMLVAASPAQAAITNTATANGSPARGTLTPPTDSESVPVATPAPALTVAKTVSAVTVANGTSATVSDAGDTIAYRYVVTNSGNVTLSNVAPVDAGPSFNGQTAGGAALTFVHASGDPANTTGATPASVAPGQSVVFTATYTMTEEDALFGAQIDNGVTNSATAAADPVGGVTAATNTSTATTSLAAEPTLSIVKDYSFTTDGGVTGQADVDDQITYSYTVTNTGNVAITGVSISDLHEGSALPAGSVGGETLTSDGPLAAATPSVISSDGTANDGSWDTLQPGAVITFTYLHTVTQAEFDAQ